VISRRTVLKSGATLLAAAGTGGLYGAAAAAGESRAILNEGFNWLDREQGRRMMARISDAGFNVLITCVWHGTGATWPSKIAPLAEGYAGGDQFAALLEQAAAHGIEVHAWFCVAACQRDFLTAFRPSGTPEQKFEIHLPGFRRFIGDTILEFVARYPVQGVNLDYVRAGGISSSDAAVSDYKQRTGRSLLVDRLLPSTEARAAISEWQQAAVRDVVLAVSQGARAARPGVIVSVDAAPWYPPYLLEGQNSVRWADDGLIDVLYSMNYETVLEVAKLNEIKRGMRRPDALVPIVSNYVAPGGVISSRPSEGLTGLISQARTVSDANGVAVYLYNMLDAAQIEALRHGTFSAAAAPRWRRAAGSVT
jgi:uncharacterized lipoprotein YddW (UPF0748 family)